MAEEVFCEVIKIILETDNADDRRSNSCSIP